MGRKCTDGDDVWRWERVGWKGKGSDACIGSTGRGFEDGASMAYFWQGGGVQREKEK